MINYFTGEHLTEHISVKNTTPDSPDSFCFVGCSTGDDGVEFGLKVKKILLTRGKYALIDDEDYERVSRFKWSAVTNGYTWYAKTNIYVGGRWKYCLMHRFILNVPEGSQTDHLNGDGLCNLRNNIRICTCTQNHQNHRRAKNKSGYKGVYSHKYGWQAQIQINGTKICLGVHQTKEDAANAYDKAAIKYFGEFACTNKMILKEKS